MKRTYCLPHLAVCLVTLTLVVGCSEKRSVAPVKTDEAAVTSENAAVEQTPAQPADGASATPE